MLETIRKIFKKEPVNFYELLGNEVGIKKLVRDFYRIMESDPNAIDCLMAHELEDGVIPEEVKRKLYLFLSGWLGGPQLFVQEFGHPRMRMRHAHVKIGEKEADQWLYCMIKALDDHYPKIPAKEQKQLIKSFAALAYRIKNRNDSPTTQA